MIVDQIKKDLTEILEKLKISSEKLSLEHPLRQAQGDYSTNIAMRKPRRKRSRSGIDFPLDLANKIVNSWRSSGLPKYVAKIQVAKPGFINIWLKNEVLISEIEKVLKEKKKYGSSNLGKGKTVVIDYSSPNIARPFGIGHLRSTVIGQAIYNLYQFLGYKTVGVNHLGDWGTQFGKLIVAIKKWHQGEVRGLTIDKLEKLYVKFHQEAAKKPELEDEARAWFKKLEDKDSEARKIWRACVEISLKEFKRIYELLGVEIDYSLGESFYEDKVMVVIEKAKRKQVAVESEGALVIKFPELNFPPAMLLKSDGATTYEARDLACIAYRKKRWQPALFIYEVGIDQKLHFQQTFAAAVKLGLGQLEQFVHVAHGLIQFEGGKMSTRAGKIVHLEEVLNEAVKRAQKLSEKRQKKIAQVVGVGAVKYFDLMHHPSTDIVFDWEKMFVLEGNSASYLQYTYARCRSVLKKSPIAIPDRIHIHDPVSDEEVALLRTIYKFPEVVSEAGESYAPNLVCNFLFDLAQKYNLFYNRQPILKAGNPELVEGRLALTSAVSQIIKNGLYLLGIEAPERM